MSVENRLAAVGLKHLLSCCSSAGERNSKISFKRDRRRPEKSPGPHKRPSMSGFTHTWGLIKKSFGSERRPGREKVCVPNTNSYCWLYQTVKVFKFLCVGVFLIHMNTKPHFTWVSCTSEMLSLQNWIDMFSLTTKKDPEEPPSANLGEGPLWALCQSEVFRSKPLDFQQLMHWQWLMAG